MPLIQIEQDDPEVVSRARQAIGDVLKAPDEAQVSFIHAGAFGWIHALVREGLISQPLCVTLRDELEAARRAWVRPERGQGGDYE